MPMPLRWLWLDHVPAGIHLSREDRHTVAMHAGVLRRNHPHFRNAARRNLKYSLPLVVMYGAVLAAAYWGPHGFMTFGIGTPLLVGFVWYGQYRTGAPFVWRSMAKVGYEVCLSCGYPLRGLADDAEHCPECGEARDAETRNEAEARAAMRGMDRASAGSPGGP